MVGSASKHGGRETVKSSQQELFAWSGSVQEFEMGEHGGVFITNERADALDQETPGIKEKRQLRT